MLLPRLGFACVRLPLSIAVTGCAQQAAQPAVSCKSEVGVVEINAVVTDGAGHFVGDLTKDDFQVYEDGRARPFSLFSLVNLPVAPAAVRSAAPEPDVRTLADSRNGRSEERRVGKECRDRGGR